MATQVGHWGIWGTYEEPEGGLNSPAIAEQYLKELREVGPYPEGSAGTKEEDIQRAEKRLADLRAMEKMTPSQRKQHGEMSVRKALANFRKGLKH